MDRRDPNILQLARKYNSLCSKMSMDVPTGLHCPIPIPTKNLFDLDVDSIVWRNDDLQDASEGGEVPRWLGDENVRRGIPAFLEVKRCNEELCRLAKERTTLQRWFRQTWQQTSAALSHTCECSTHFATPVCSCP